MNANRTLQFFPFRFSLFFLRGRVVRNWWSSLTLVRAEEVLGAGVTQMVNFLAGETRQGSEQVCPTWAGADGEGPGVGEGAGKRARLSDWSLPHDGCGIWSSPPQHVQAVLLLMRDGPAAGRAFPWPDFSRPSVHCLHGGCGSCGFV